MRYMMQNFQVERKFQTLTSNRQSIFQILNLENDEINNENDTFKSEELQAFSNISKELPSGGATGEENHLRIFLPPTKQNVLLSDKLLDLLIGYYNCAYKYNFS